MCHYRSKVPNVLIAITVFHVNLCSIFYTKEEAVQWLERDSLPMSLPAVRFRTRFGVEYLEKCHVPPLSMFGNCFDVVTVRGQGHYPHMLHLSYV